MAPFLRFLLVLALTAAVFVFAPWPRVQDYAGPAPLLSSHGAMAPAGGEWESEWLPDVPGHRYLVTVSASSAVPFRLFLRSSVKESDYREIVAPYGKARVFALSLKGPCRLVLQGGRFRAAASFPDIEVRPILTTYPRARGLAIDLRLVGLGILCGMLLWGLRPGAAPAGRLLLYRWGLPIVLSCLIAVGLTARYSRDHGFTGLVQMGSTLFDRATPRARAVDFQVDSHYGYDGGQYVQLALDPALSDRAALARALDAPSYRAKRIGLPWLAWVVGLGRPAWIVEAEALLNVAFWLLLLVVLLRAFPAPSPEHAAVLVGVLLSTGALESIRNALTDLPSTVLLAVALVLPLRFRPLAWGAAVLTRETSVFASPLLLGGKGKEAAWKWAAIAVAAAAIGGWFAYILRVFPYENQPLSNLGWPFAAMWGRIQDIPSTGGWMSSANFWVVPAIVSLLVQAVFLVRHSRPASAAWRMGILFVPLYLCVQHAVWESYYAVTRAILPMTLAFHWELAALRGRRFWAWWLPANFFGWHGLLIYLFP